MKYESSAKDRAKAREYIRKHQMNENYDEGGYELMTMPKEVRYALAEIYLKEWTKLAKSGKVK